MKIKITLSIVALALSALAAPRPAHLHLADIAPCSNCGAASSGASEGNTTGQPTDNADPSVGTSSTGY